MIGFKRPERTWEMDQQVKVLATKPDPSLIPRAQMVKREKEPTPSLDL